ncbi:hypothetical protein [Caldicellulosiruptor hydrothermalis]|uniref:hypothetical protein n=1 Tax=Caldicellulosiruptor hydrothermalis TaxID=413888 RepID=UPI000674CEDB|nr:hypothetical protein [Caldicellulosiruptor hydrothermalis]
MGGQEEPLKIDLKEVNSDEIKTNDSKSEKIENKASNGENSNNILQQDVTKLNTETGYISWYNGEGKKEQQELYWIAKVLHIRQLNFGQG